MNKKFSLSNLLDSKGFSAFMATLMAIIIGLIFGFLVMLIASQCGTWIYERFNRRS